MAISAKQLEANRQNARRSTGPRTLQGKAVSSQNATTHGVFCGRLLLDGEDPAELTALRQGYLDQYDPRTMPERVLVDQIVGIVWRLQRLQSAEYWSHRTVSKEALAAYRCCYAREVRKEGSNDLPAGFTTHFSFGSTTERYSILEQRLTNLMLRCTRELRLMIEARGEMDEEPDATNTASEDPEFRGTGCQPVQEASSARAGSPCHDEEPRTTGADDSSKTQNEAISPASDDADVISAGSAPVVMPSPVLSKPAKAMDRADGRIYTAPDV